MSQSSGMNPEIYRAAMAGDWETIQRLCPDFATQVFPNRNTILHVLAKFSDSFAEAVQQITARERNLVFKRNEDLETPLVIASRRGHSNLVRALIDSANQAAASSSSSGAKIIERAQMFRFLGYHSALVEAVKNNNREVAKLLLQVEEVVLDDVSFVPLVCSAHWESPLYLAVEKGYDDIVALILSKSKTLIRSYDPDLGTPLHAAALRNSLGCMELILEKLPAITKEVDGFGWSALHVASMLNYTESVKLLLSADNSLGYLRVKTGDKMTALHIAVCRGHLDVIREILLHCPDCWEMVTFGCKNVLHLAVENERQKVLEFILDTWWVSELINKKDLRGNTPLHLYVSTNNLNGHKLINHPCVYKNSRNYDGLSPLGIIVQKADKVTERQNLIRDELVNAGATPALRRLPPFRKSEKNGHSDQTYGTYMVVAALIVTVTFAAGFTIPGGYDNSAGNEGKAVLSKHAAFTAFVVSDSLAMLFAVIAMLVHFIFAVENDWSGSFGIFSNEPLVDITFSITLSIGLMVIAFLTGLYVVLPVRALKIYLIVVGSVIGLPIPVYFLGSLCIIIITGKHVQEPQGVRPLV